MNSHYYFLISALSATVQTDDSLVQTNNLSRYVILKDEYATQNCARRTLEPLRISLRTSGPSTLLFRAVKRILGDRRLHNKEEVEMSFCELLWMHEPSKNIDGINAHVKKDKYIVIFRNMKKKKW